METTDNFRKHTSTNPLQRFLLDNFFSSMIQIIKPLPIDSILDVGCGEGFTLARIARERIDTHLEGIEYLDTAIKIGRGIHPHIKFTKGDIYKLPYKDNSFDLVLCTEVLEHLDNPKKALSELIRVSKNYLLLSVPNEPIFMASNFLRGKNWSRWGNDIEHINHWSSNNFERFVLQNSHSDLSRIHSKDDSGVAQAPQNDIKIIRKSRPFPWTMLLFRKITE